MSGRVAQRIENGVDAGAALLLAGAVLSVALKLGLPSLLATGWAVLGFLLCFRLLGWVGPTHAGHPVSEFAVRAFQPDPPELLLVDELAAVGADSRVVQLFETSASVQAATPDASDALYDALAGLRRSLRQVTPQS